MTNPGGLRRIVELGISDETAPSDMRCIKLVNAVALLALISTGCSFALNIELHAIVPPLAALVVFCVVLMLNHCGRPLGAQMVVILGTLLTTTIQTVALGLTSGLQYYLLPAAFLPYFVFPRHRVALSSAFSLLAGVLLISLAWLSERLPAAMMWEQREHWFVLSLSLSAILITITGAYARALSLACEAQIDRRRHDNRTLIHDVLPARIADRLFTGASSAIDVYEDAIILHADIAGFTPLAEAMPPEALVALLDELISAFDEVCARHGVEKLKTVGDAYIAAAGVPGREPDAADRALAAAVDILAATRAVRERGGLALELRIGIACGSVAAGIVGKQRYSLELCGEALDRAEALQQSARPGTVVLDAATRARVRIHAPTAESDDRYILA